MECIGFVLFFCTADVGGVVDGSVVVWEFGGGPPVATLREGTVGGVFNNASGSSGAVGSNIIASASASIAGAVAGTSGAGSARVARVRFNGSGSKVAAVDYSGRLSLWSLDLNDPKPNPYFVSLDPLIRTHAFRLLLMQHVLL